MLGYLLAVYAGYAEETAGGPTNSADFYWDEDKTEMNCVRQAVRLTRQKL